MITTIDKSHKLITDSHTARMRSSQDLWLRSRRLKLNSVHSESIQVTSARTDRNIEHAVTLDVPLDEMSPALIVACTIYMRCRLL